MQLCVSDELQFCQSSLVLKRKHFLTLVSCLSPYIAASPRLVVTVSKTLPTCQEQLNMKVMVSRGTVCKKKSETKPFPIQLPLQICLEPMHYFRAFSPWLWPSFSCQRSIKQNNLGQFSNSLLRKENLTLVQSWLVLQFTSEEGKPDPSTILVIADDLCFRSLAPLPLSLTPSVPP